MNSLRISALKLHDHLLQIRAINQVKIPHGIAKPKIVIAPNKGVPTHSGNMNDKSHNKLRKAFPS